MNENEESKKQIMISVELLDHDICMACPEMAITNEQVIYYHGDSKSYDNRLRCEHVERCRKLVDGWKEAHGNA